MLPIVEKFLSISGEAPIIGFPSYIVRFSGCNLSCIYCDTMYKNEINDNFTKEELIDEIDNAVSDYPEVKVLFTGGEPMLPERESIILEIIEELDKVDFFIETNGSIELENFILSNCHYIVDWKSPSSGENESFCIENIKNLRINNDCIKFVISRDDFEWVKESIKIAIKLNPFIPIYLQAVYNKLELNELADFILKNRLPVKMSVQLHKYIWKNIERGV